MPELNEHYATTAKTAEINDVCETCQAELRLLQQEVVGENTISPEILAYAEHFTADFGEENILVVAQVLQEIQQADFLPYGEDLTLYATADILPLINKELETEIVTSDIPRFDHKSTGRKRLVSGIKEEATEVKEEAIEVKEEATEVKEEAIEVKEEVVGNNEIFVETIEADFRNLLAYFSGNGGSTLAQYKNNFTAEALNSNPIFIAAKEDNPELKVESLVDFAQAFFAEHEQNLSRIESFFTSSEITQIFGGSLFENVRIDLVAGTTAQQYQEVFQKIDAGIADEDRRRELRAQVEQTLGIKANVVQVKTGGEVNEAFKNGYGIETYVDEEGKVHQRRVPIGPGFELEYQAGYTLSIDDQGDKYVAISSHAGPSVRVKLPDNPSAQVMGDIIRTAETRAMMRALDMEAFFYPESALALTNGDEIKIEPADYKITQQIWGVLMGAQLLGGNELLSGDQINQAMKWLSLPDSSGADFDPTASLEQRLKTQKILNENGSINWDYYRNMVATNRAST